MKQYLNPSLYTVATLSNITNIDTLWATINNQLIEIISFESNSSYFETTSLQNDFNSIKEFLSL